MAKIHLIGTVVAGPIKGLIEQKNNTPICKYLVSVSSETSSDTKISYFGVTAYGKKAEVAVAIGNKVELDGNLEISNFQLNAKNPAKQAAVVTPQRTVVLNGNLKEFAKAYNVLGNLVLGDAEAYNASNMVIYTQKIAVRKKQKKEQQESEASFFKIKFFGERGTYLMQKQWLNKTNVKSILVDGLISASYTKKEKNGENKEYFNCEISVNDFQIAAWPSNNTQQQNTQQQQYGNASQNAYREIPVEVDGQPYTVPEMEDIDEDAIPF